jgi:hypothetical protein
VFGLDGAGRMLIFAAVVAVLGACGMIIKLWRFDDFTLRMMLGK